MGSANIATINDDLDGNGFWVIKEEIHMLICEPDPKPSDIELDDNNNDDKASCAELTGTEDEQASDWFGSDNQLASEGEESYTKEEANTATLKEEAAPCSEAQPIPHHMLHMPTTIHTLASLGTLDKGADNLRIVPLCRECITKRQNQTLLELLWVLWHVIWVWLLKPMWGTALQLTILSKHTFEALYQTSPAKGKAQCIQASLLEGEEMRMPSTSSEQSAALASFEGIKDTPVAFMVETADAEALKPCSLPKAANIKQHTSHLLAHEPSPVSSVHPNNPKPS